MFENPFKIQRGTICVMRRYAWEGFLVYCAFAINHQHHYKEWEGCFSIL